jgi:hypothetical protein
MNIQEFPDFELFDHTGNVTFLLRFQGQPSFPPDQDHVGMSVAAVGRNAAVARGGDGLIRARHR